MNRKNALVETVPLPHPAEDLSVDDDLLSWVLVDQLGALPNTKLGVLSQQVKFVGQPFKTEEVLNIVRETVTKGHLAPAIQRLSEFHLIQDHVASKLTEGQKERFMQHLRRYLLPLMPNSRVEFHTTARYTAVTGHVELAVFATRPLAAGMVLQELQGSVVPLPNEWRQEMDIGDDFAVQAAEEEVESEYDSGEDSDTSATGSTAKGKGKARDKESRRAGPRRSDRTKRRDFSIVWSGLKRCFQLFLGPARFLNHDCTPNVELLRQGRYVTFRVLRSIKIGDEITTFYGDRYFGKDNIECLCLTCERNQRGAFTPKTQAGGSRSQSRDVSAAPSPRVPKPSNLKHVASGEDAALNSPATTESTPGPRTPSKGKENEAASVLDEVSIMSDDEDSDGELTRREPSKRLAAKKVKPWAYMRSVKGVLEAKSIHKAANRPQAPVESVEDDLPPDFPRCATCLKPLHERVWYANRYFDHCNRCVRHSLIFELPWPAHKAQDVLEFPPSHLIPPRWKPFKISSIPLPSLSKKKPSEPIVPMLKHDYTAADLLPLNKPDRSALRLRAMIEMQEFMIEQLREEAWAKQLMEEEMAQQLADEKNDAERRRAADRAKREAERIRKLEEKRIQDAGKIKGSGVWSKYEMVSAEEWQRRMDEKNKVTSGTRRGGRFRTADDDAEMRQLAEAQIKRAREKAEREEERERQRREDLKRKQGSLDWMATPGAGPSNSRSMEEEAGTPERPSRSQSSDGPRRGRPPGSGKHQKKRAHEMLDRQRLEQSQEDPPNPTRLEGSSAPERIPTAARSFAPTPAVPAAPVMTTSLTGTGFARTIHDARKEKQRPDAPRPTGASLVSTLSAMPSPGRPRAIMKITPTDFYKKKTDGIAAPAAPRPTSSSTTNHSPLKKRADATSPLNIAASPSTTIPLAKDRSTADSTSKASTSKPPLTPNSSPLKLKIQISSNQKGKGPLVPAAPSEEMTPGRLVVGSNSSVYIRTMVDHRTGQTNQVIELCDDDDDDDDDHSVQVIGSSEEGDSDDDSIRVIDSDEFEAAIARNKAASLAKRLSKAAVSRRIRVDDSGDDEHDQAVINNDVLGEASGTASTADSLPPSPSSTSNHSYGRDAATTARNDLPGSSRRPFLIDTYRPESTHKRDRLSEEIEIQTPNKKRRTFFHNGLLSTVAPKTATPATLRQAPPGLP